MASHLKLKVLLVGPEKCGKSQMANFLAELTESLPGPDAPYTPTAGKYCVMCAIWCLILRCPVWQKLTDTGCVL